MSGVGFSELSTIGSGMLLRSLFRTQELKKAEAQVF